MTRFIVPALGAGVLLPWIVAVVTDDKQTEPTSVERATGIPGAEYVYVGTKKCRMCHTLQNESLMASRKANSWNALRPGESAAVKKRAGLDVEKDYTVDPACLECHAVGFGKPGGYFIPDPRDKKLVRVAATRRGVGCESCHGPGSGFMEVMRDVVRRERTYRPEEVYALGRKIVVTAVILIFIGDFIEEPSWLQE